MTTENWGAIYKEMGATPVINATGSVTLLGGSTPVAEVKAAMDAADSAFIPLIELEQVAGDRIAEMLGVPAAYITSGAGSALTLMTAAFMALRAFSCFCCGRISSSHMSRKITGSQ